MQIGNIDTGHLRGFADKVFGLTKELLGTVLGNEGLQEEGEAQQARGTESLKALRHEARAQAAEAKAEGLQQRQKAAQRDRQSA